MRAVLRAHQIEGKSSSHEVLVLFRPNYFGVPLLNGQRAPPIPSLAGKVHFSALASHPLNLGLTYGRLQGARA
jgi:hypothetical protein